MHSYLFLLHPIWTALFWFTFVAFFAVGSWAGNRERNMIRGESRDRGSRLVIYVFSFAGIALAFILPNAVPFGWITLPAVQLFLASMAMFWSGIALYVWAVL